MLVDVVNSTMLTMCCCWL